MARYRRSNSVRARGRSGSYRRTGGRVSARRTSGRGSARRSGGTTRVVVQVVGAQPAAAAPFMTAAPAPRVRKF